MKAVTKKRTTKKEQQPIQISKEYWDGKWQLVGFYREGGRIVLRPMKLSRRGGDRGKSRSKRS